MRPQHCSVPSSRRAQLVAGSDRDDSGRPDGCDRHGRQLPLASAVPDLTLSVLTPAVDGAGVEQHAAMQLAHRHLDHSKVAGEVDAGGYYSVVVGAVAELTVGVVAPALHATGWRHGTAVVVAQGDASGGHVASRGDHRRGDQRGRHRGDGDHHPRQEQQTDSRRVLSRPVYAAEGAFHEGLAPHHGSVVV